MEIQFIEPCCAEKQLPALLREQRIAPFQTNGDVTFEYILKSVACLAGNILGIRLMLPTIDTTMLRNLAWFGRRGWLKRLEVLTHDNQLELIHREITDSVDDLRCYNHDSVAESILIIKGEYATVVVQGHFTSKVEPSHRFFTAAIGQTDSDTIRQFTAPFAPLMSARYESKPATPSVEPEQSAPEDTAEGQKTADATVLGDSVAEQEPKKKRSQKKK